MHRAPALEHLRGARLMRGSFEARRPPTYLRALTRAHHYGCRCCPHRDQLNARRHSHGNWSAHFVRLQRGIALGWVHTTQFPCVGVAHLCRCGQRAGLVLAPLAEALVACVWCVRGKAVRRRTYVLPRASTHIYTHVRTRIRTYAHASAHTHTCARTRKHTHTHAHMHAHTHTHARARPHTNTQTHTPWKKRTQ